MALAACRREASPAGEAEIAAPPPSPVEAPAPPDVNGAQPRVIAEESEKLGIRRLGGPLDPEPPRRETVAQKARRKKRDEERVGRLAEEFRRANEAMDDAADKSVKLEGKVAAPLHRPPEGGVVEGPSQVRAGAWAGANAGAVRIGVRLILHADAWAAAWGRLSPDAPPPLDFAKTRVSAKFLGPRAGAGVRLVAVDERKDAWVVRWALSPGEDAPSPYLLISLPKDARAVRWQEEKPR